MHVRPAVGLLTFFEKQKRGGGKRMGSQKNGIDIL